MILRQLPELKDTTPPEMLQTWLHSPQMNRILLSSTGSDRATAYIMSNKIIRLGSQVFVGWLDAPEAPDTNAKVMLGVIDSQTGALQHSFSLGEVHDNHCGPALVVDRNERMHAVLGAHSSVFQYRWSDDPANAKSWSEPEPLGSNSTYPSLVVDMAGTLHLAHRETTRPWQLWYRRKKAGAPWETPVAIAVSPAPGYNFFAGSLQVGPEGNLHLFFMFHYATSGLAADTKGRMAVYLHSTDGGDTWSNEGKNCSFPLTMESAAPIRHYPDGGLRISNHVVDSKDRPWVFLMVPDQPHGLLLRKDGRVWTAVDISATLGKLSWGQSGREVSFSRSADGRIHVVACTSPDDSVAAWFDPGHELFHLVLDEEGNTLSFGQISQSDPAVANWLPALENWDWTRPQASCGDSPWLAYTHGNNAGGIGSNNRNSLTTDVFLTHLDLV